MDKPRHPQVIQTWKTREAQKKKWSAQPGGQLRREFPGSRKTKSAK